MEGIHSFYDLEKGDERGDWGERVVLRPDVIGTLEESSNISSEEGRREGSEDNAAGLKSELAFETSTLREVRSPQKTMT